MWEYQKTLQFPINIKNPNPKLAAFIVSQYGGPDGELAASLRYLSQRYAMKDNVVKGILTDIGSSCSKCSHIYQHVLLHRSGQILCYMGAN